MYYSKGGYKYRVEQEPVILQSTVMPAELLETQYFTLDTTGQLTLLVGYACDGPSGPTLDMIFPWLYKKFIVPACGHDALYQSGRNGWIPPETRILADQDLQHWCLDRKMAEFRANIIYRSVRDGAGFAFKPKHKRKIYFVP